VVNLRHTITALLFVLGALPMIVEAKPRHEWPESFMIYYVVLYAVRLTLILAGSTFLGGLFDLKRRYLVFGVCLLAAMLPMIVEGRPNHELPETVLLVYRMLSLLRLVLVLLGATMVANLLDSCISRSLSSRARRHDS
jgi:predicted neutral ceramidase superfamily lipid hydrolase